MAEWVLGRPIRSVLDVGCGEGNWRAPLRRLRPTVHYEGVDPSTYAVARYGRRRQLHLGGITSLQELPLRASYDLVVCCGMLNYLDEDTLRADCARYRSEPVVSRIWSSSPVRMLLKGIPAGRPRNHRRGIGACCAAPDCAPSACTDTSAVPSNIGWRRWSSERPEVTF